MTFARRLLAACCGVLALALAPGAAAQAPQVDPGSPAGIEYQLPVDRAREEAQGGSSGGGASAAGEAPLFGAGVEPEDGGQPGASSKPKPGSGDDAQTSGASSAVVRSYADAPGGSAGELAIGAGAVGVLAIGSVAGLAWRRRAMRG